MPPFSSSPAPIPSPRRVSSPPPSPVKKYRSIADIMERTKPAGTDPDDYDDVICQKCGSGDGADELLLCDKCDRGFHMACLRPVVVRIPIGNWFCPDCALRPRVGRFSEKKIMKFFKIKRNPFVDRKLSSSQGLVQKAKRRKRRPITMQKRKRRMLPFVPEEDERRRLKQMRSLASALTAVGIGFTNELTYGEGMAPRSANRADLEVGGIQVLSKEDIETMERCIAMMEQGLFPPLLVVYDSLEGYTVQADSNIKDMTFLGEYCGDVDYLMKREADDSESLMTLLLAEDPLKSLVICPDRHSNIIRFVSGINNHVRGGKKRQNVKSMRYNINGEIRVILVTTRDIAKGERLYFDYNGYVYDYPTHHFV